MRLTLIVLALLVVASLIDGCHPYGGLTQNDRIY